MTMTKFVHRSAVLLALLLAGGCAPTYVASTPQVYNPVDSFQAYTQRVDKVTLSGGDAQAVNTRVQEIDPWPRYVGNKRIVTSGERMAGAAERYRDTSKTEKAPKPLPVESTSGGG